MTIDHLIYAAGTLEQGMDAIELLLGVRPVPGGQHPQYGTHNALLSLGATTYLEVIAPDPSLPQPDRGVLVGDSNRDAPRLVTWVLGVTNIEAAAAAGVAAGLGPVQNGSRVTPAGETISWKLTDPYAMPQDGAVPFLIDWGYSTHPASVAPAGGKFLGLAIEHPEADSVQGALALLNVDIVVQQAASYRLSARIETPAGVRVLR